MLTTSNSRDRSRTVARPGCWLVTVAIGGCALPPASPDSPRPAVALAQATSGPWAASYATRPVRLRSVSVGKVGAELRERAGARFLAQASNPLVIQVDVVDPIEPAPRTSSPVIELNGRPLHNTTVDRDDATRLVAFLPDRRLIAKRNQVVVYWVGSETETRSPSPLVFTAEDVP